MPEYLAPGVYVEEVSFRGKSIEGVSTSVTGFVGSTLSGPVGGVPEILTSFADFEAIYGGIDSLQHLDSADVDAAVAGAGLPADLDTLTEAPVINDMAHAVRSFFDNGGSKLYVTRIFEDITDDDGDTLDDGHAQATVGTPAVLTLRARFPGRAGRMEVTFGVQTLGDANATGTPTGLSAGDVVFARRGSIDSAQAADDGFYDVVDSGGTLIFQNSGGATLNPGGYRLYPVRLSVTVDPPGRFPVTETEVNLHPNPGSEDPQALVQRFPQAPPTRTRQLTQKISMAVAAGNTGADLCDALFDQDVVDALQRHLSTDPELRSAASPTVVRDRPTTEEMRVVVSLGGGHDGLRPTARAYRGRETGMRKTGLETFTDIDEISIVAAPGGSRGGNTDAERYQTIVQNLLTHCERMRYRVAVLDSPDQQAISEVRASRAVLDSKHAGFYYPWVTVLDPLDPEGRREIDVPPSGFVAGIWARNDAERGVFKAPANEVVRGAIGFEFTLNKAQQDILNPGGVNCFRSFKGRGHRLWGARTISSDPEWKYISTRRYFAYLEHSIEKGTQWAVFENNGDRLWANVRQTIRDFLINEWKSGALLGATEDEAFFVRCDRSTMTQYNLDNGQLICLIGVAVVKPAEFVIFRIGQKTADAS
jgi:phage tail sheath protein FI